MENLDDFIAWFTQNGGWLSPSVGFKEFSTSEGGRGCVALKDVAENETLFTIPRNITLSTRTSSLPSKIGLDNWKKYGLDKGWVGLILCMLYEAERKENWGPYLESLPTTFDTPMFWDTSDLEELRGTSIPDKIGKEDAEKNYHEKLLPAVQSRPDLFPSGTLESLYSLEAYHMMGSRILSRSFHVEKWDDQDGDSSAMDIDQNEEDGGGEDAQIEDGDGDTSDDEDTEDPADVAMVPVADLLNARFGASNAKLFYESKDLKMVCTKPVKVGEQIWNTYAEPPNSDLLRRYGHVDELPLPEDSIVGNPNDLVEVGANLVKDFIETTGEREKEERIEWWLEEGGDDTFVLEYEGMGALPPDMLSLVRLLRMTREEWDKAREKGKLPKAKNITSEEALILKNVFQRRLDMYAGGSFTDDKSLLDTNVSKRKRNAIFVRMGEKLILEKVLSRLDEILENGPDGGRKGKRKADGGEAGKAGKRAR